MSHPIKIGLDIGSTTAKLVVLGENNELLYSKYKRHYSDIRTTVSEMIIGVYRHYKEAMITVLATGSGGLSVSKWLEVGFIQEVVASAKTIREVVPRTDVAIELGGEDAKITYFESGSIDQRMNGTCAGGTGAFIDQMAALLQTDAAGLDSLAKNHRQLYPIAARCGVFAKTDVQPLLNEGAATEDIAASILQAVVNQTIGGLACGKPIRGNVAFLGGPLHFLPELRKRFIETLGLTREQQIVPDQSQLFVAMGAAMASAKEERIPFQKLFDRLSHLEQGTAKEVQRLKPLFESAEALSAFRRRHGKEKVLRADISKHRGACYLGIDAGSTTTKAVLTDGDGAILFEHYDSNKGKPIKKVREILEHLYSELPEDATLRGACVTGYGEGLIKEAFNLDFGEIETIAHYKAAERFLPGVEFILDIGGQDMKCMRVREGIIDDILLNEACSSGCGSFLETFAGSLNMTIQTFAEAALQSDSPVDLGSRCTVFMNSRVKQAQKEGASLGDISAGLSYSVIKNALQKVIKVRDPKQLGEKVIVQGGTFHNEAVLRAFEMISGKEVVRPDISGLMGAYGAALVAAEKAPKDHISSILTTEDLSGFTVETHMERCPLCSNHCLLTKNSFAGGAVYISGNRCERGSGKPLAADEKAAPDLFKYKEKKIFSYKSLSNKDAIRGTVGIPRVLNFYENYPYWHTFFTELGYRVVLSPKSTRKIFEAGMENIPSESVCYPAKLAHGHVNKLIEQGVDFIFYPCVPLEVKEDEGADNHFNCPVVTSYPESIRHNTDAIVHGQIEFVSPFLPMDNSERLAERLSDVFAKRGIEPKLIKAAAAKAWKEKLSAREAIQSEGERVLKWIEDNDREGIVLAGRPYHVDPEVNHGLTSIITELGMAVLTEDSISHLGRVERPLRVLDQWTYHSRLYNAAHVVGDNDRLALVQLTSFGCGVDAVTSDQVQEILQSYGDIYTLIKIDEGNNLGAVKIRMRSLKAAMDERRKQHIKAVKTSSVSQRVSFTEENRKQHTILAPQMAPMQFDLYETGFKALGYNVVILPTVDYHAIDQGLTYVNNDACYPCIIVVGQIMQALKSGKYDLNHVSVFISQTAGGCRASNYIGFLRKALADADMAHIPVVSLNVAGLEGNPGFKIDLPLVHRALMGTVYGDLFMRLVNATKPYEANAGEVERLYQKWRIKAKENLMNGSILQYNRNVKAIVQDFSAIKRLDVTKPKVGIVGEILIKYHPTGNNELAKVLEAEGVEVVIPDLMDFFLYWAYNEKFKFESLNGSRKAWFGAKMAVRLMELYRQPVIKALEGTVYTKPSKITDKAAMAEKLISLGNQTGEGWFLTGEMVELVHEGVNNVVCVQPFGCLPNHVVGKSMIKPIKKLYPKANICAIDYDPGASEVNQLNRIKLMLSVAFEQGELKSDVPVRTAPIDDDEIYA